ncbi:hypothetical protein MAR_019756 [Mya arenaria]|uniref:YqaJ viral recombinase domain-containing protein n=1 Tax=Mya arenaria TaxID=6604 RepID=A0ABY7E2Z7_MYAAR|nr:hypothetical protein MAR_019756 [Mya arenaria]
MIIGGCDPYEAKLAGTQNVDIFPSVTYSDIVNYLLFTPSAYSAADLTPAFCLWMGQRHCRNRTGGSSGEAFDYLQMEQYTTNVIQCQCDTGVNVKYFLSLQVLHSQRMREKPLRPWIIGKRDGKKVAAHFNCIISLGESCSYIVAFLFYIEAAVEIRDSNTSGSLMSAKTAKKHMDSRIEAASSATPVTPGAVSTRKRTVTGASNEDFLLFCGKLNKLTSEPALLSIVEPYANKYVPKPDLRMITTNVLCFKQQADNVEEEMRGQARSKLWQMFRAGRNLIKEICYPSEKYVQTNATKWGCDHEKDALQKFMEEIWPLHENSRLQNSGFVISQDVPFIVASPDGIFICDCCGPACVEVPIQCSL